MFGPARVSGVLLLVLIALAVAACGFGEASSPSSGSGRPQASGGAPSGSAAAGPAATGSPSADANPSVEGFWKLAARALSRSGRLRLVMTGGATRELRFEPKASAAVADGAVTSVCLAGAAYTIRGITSTRVPARWACGGSALVSSFRKSGQPVYAWNTRLPVDTKIKERVALVAKGRWQWDYTATSTIFHGTVHTTLLLDVATGRLTSGSRTDPTGTTRYTFSYTTILAPIALP